MHKLKSLLFVALAIFMVAMQSCTVVDNSEVGIKFKKFGLTDQGLGLQDLMETIEPEDSRNLLKEAIRRLSIKPHIPFNDEQFNV